MSMTQIVIFKHVYLFSGTASNIPSFIQMSDFAQQKAAALLLLMQFEHDEALIDAQYQVLLVSMLDRVIIRNILV